MNKDTAKKASEIVSKITFAANQIKHLKESIAQLELRQDFKNTLKLDLTMYAHETVPFCKVAIPNWLLSSIAADTELHWNEEITRLEKELNNLEVK